jgi:hypothetical protein
MWEIRDGLVTRFHVVPNREAARAEARDAESRSDVGPGACGARCSCGYAEHDHHHNRRDEHGRDGAVRGFTACDRYASVPIPGRETLDLPSGDVTVYYREDVDLGDNENLHPPPDIGLDGQSGDGGRPLKLDGDGSRTRSRTGSGRACRSVTPMCPSRATTRSPPAPPGRLADPAIVFGDDLFDGFVSALPLGLLVFGGGVGMAALVAALIFVRRRRVRESGLAR